MSNFDIAEEKISYDPHGVPTYTIRFEKLKEKMKSLENAKSIESPTFKLRNGADLSLVIYPNGDKPESKGNVSLYIKNKSDYKIIFDAELKFAKLKNRMGVGVMYPWSTYGYTSYVTHSVCNDIVEESLGIECTFLKVEPIIGSGSSDIANNNASKTKPQCPICMEDMTSSTKIAQCINGHLMCWPCMEGMRGRQCVCGLPVNGRCFGMENYLKTIFG